MKHVQRIAVLEDDVKFIRLIELLLRGEHLEVQPVTTPDVDEAVRVVTSSVCIEALVDVYLCDAALGFTFIEKLRHPGGE